MNRIILDNNVIISFLISDKSVPGRSVCYALDNDKIFISKPILSELHSKLLNKKFHKYFTTEDVNIFIKGYQNISKILMCRKKFNLCRDPKDNMFLDLAYKSEADFIITGDKDLLTLKEFKKTQIITPRRYLDL